MKLEVELDPLHPWRRRPDLRVVTMKLEVELDPLHPWRRRPDLRVVTMKLEVELDHCTHGAVDRTFAW